MSVTAVESLRQTPVKELQSYRDFHVAECQRASDILEARLAHLAQVEEALGAQATDHVQLELSYSSI